VHSRPFSLGSFYAGCAGLLALGAVLVTVPGCGNSSPTPTAPDANQSIQTPSPPAAAPSTAPSDEPTSLDMSASRPKETPDPFAKPGAQPLVASTPAPAASGALALHKGKSPVAVAPVKAPTPPPAPPTAPAYSAVGIFGSATGPEAILAGKDSGTIIVHQGFKLKDGGYVKAIDVQARRVVIDKENYDFVLPLEALGPGTPGSSGPGALPPPPAPSGK
jgi:hypothetical protein